MEKKEAMKILKDFYDKSALFSIRTALDTVIPELTKNEDEKIRKAILELVRQSSEILGTKNQNNMIAWLEKQKNTSDKEYVFRPVAGTMIENAVEQALNQDDVVLAFNGFYTPVKGKTSDEILAEYDHWIEKQGQTFTKKDVDDAYLKGVCDAKHEIEKQSESPRTNIEIPFGAADSELQEVSYDIPEGFNAEIKDGRVVIKKVGPKLKVGDWIISNDKKSTYQVIEVKRGIYVIRDNVDNHEYHIGIEECEKSGRLWSIQDAKDGDVLVTGEMVIIFNKIHGEWVNCHCSLHSDNSLYTEDYDLLTMKYAQEIFPATKKQRDLLFQKMKEADYEWNNEKKELKKIEPKTLNADKVIEWLVANICDFEYYIERFKQDFGL